MTRVTTDEQFQEIWTKAMEGGINGRLTTDQWDEPMIVFDGWNDVEKIGDIVRACLPADFMLDNAPAYVHSVSNPDHHIEWAIGEFGFSDQFSICDHCYRAIDTQDAFMLRYWLDADLGEIICDQCLRNDKNWQFEYLQYCARHLGDQRPQIADARFVEPADHGFICLNPYSAYGEYGYGDFLIKYEGIENFPLEDHPKFPGYFISYAGDDSLRRLHTARQIDPHVLIVVQYHPVYSSTYLVWARWDDGHDPVDDQPEDIRASRAILNYVCGLIFDKYAALRSKGK